MIDFNKNNKDLFKLENPFSENIKWVSPIEKQTYLAASILYSSNENVQAIAVADQKKFREAMTLRDDKGMTPIHWASLNGNKERMKFIAKNALQEFRAAMGVQDEQMQTPIHIAASKNNTKMISYMINNFPAKCRATMTMQDKNGMTPVSLAVKNKNLEMVKLFEETGAKEFRVAMTLQDKWRGGILHSAIQANDLEMVKLIHDLAPEEFKASMKIQDNQGNTALSVAVNKNQLNILKFMAEVAPEEFKIAITKENENGVNPIDYAVKNNQLLLLKFISETAPEEFKIAITKENKDGETLIESTNTTEILKIMAESAPEEFKTTLTKLDANGSTLTHKMVKRNLIGNVKLIAEVAPDEFKTAMKMKDKQDKTPIDYATTDDNVMVKFLIEKAPAECLPAFHYLVKTNNLEELKSWAESSPGSFKAAITEVDKLGSTPIHLAAYNNRLEVLEFCFKFAPEEFTATMKMEDKEECIPILAAACTKKIEAVEFLATLIPETLKAQNSKGITVLNFFKLNRFINYKNITKLYKGDISLLKYRELDREISKRKALGHAWAIAGSTTITSHENNEVLTIGLEGNRANQWFDLMKKDFIKFRESHQGIQNEKGMLFLEELLNFSASTDMHSAKITLERIQSEIPTIVSTGFIKHEVSVLIWGDRLVICNRGLASRRPIEIYHFDPQNLDENIIQEIKDNSYKLNDIEFGEYFFETLSNKLKFSQTDLDKQLEMADFLPPQTVGNCTWVSSITAIYALLLLSEVEGKEINNVEEHIEKAVSSYQTWLEFESLQILERLINPLKKSNFFEPDHKLIVEGLRKAHLTSMKETSIKKLEAINEIYMNSLEEEAKEQLKTDLIYWKTLKTGLGLL